MEEVRLVTFKLGNEEYGVDIGLVREIIKFANITPVPNAPKFVEGLINLRGIIVPVIDIRKLFDIEPVGNKDDRRIIVVEVNGRTLGVLVDCVSEVKEIDMDNIEPVPPTISLIDHKYLGGVDKVGDKILILLELDKILNTENLMGLEAIEGLRAIEELRD
ncbi:MAG: chemotaxis protein CheW [Candidatus Anammoxibacter sp.]